MNDTPASGIEPQFDSLADPVSGAARWTPKVLPDNTQLMTKRFVLVELDTADWGVTDAASYVASRDMRGFMGTIRSVEVTPNDAKVLMVIGEDRISYGPPDA